MQDITEVYVEYKIMPLLAMHQLRVAAVAEMICDSLDIDVDKESVIKACLLHDMGNIIKFNLDYFPETLKPEGRDYWQGIKDEYIKKYGTNEHEASAKIAEEIGATDLIKDLIGAIDSKLIEDIKNSDSFEKKICIYADNRASPHHIVSLEEHSLEAKERYKNHHRSFSEESRIFFNENIKEIEKQIFSHAKIEPSEINDETVSPYIKKLRNFYV